MKNKPIRIPVTVLKALLEGQVIEHANRKWCMDDNYDLCIIGKKTVLGVQSEPKDVLLKVDYTLGDFIRHFTSMEEKDFFRLCANITLNSTR